MSQQLTKDPDIESLKRQCQPTIEALQQQLGDTLIALVLFGSRARGEHRPGSDWDLLLIAKTLPEKAFERHLYLKRILPDRWRGQVSILAKTPAEFEAFESELLLDIALDGAVLIDTHEYAENRLIALRQMMQQAGLYRDRTGQDFIWRWRQHPNFDWELIWELLP